MKDLLVKNIILSVVEKVIILAFQLLISVVLIRNLNRELLGIIAVIGGLYSIVGFINFPLENFLLKESKESHQLLNKSFNQYVTFSILKTFLFFIITILGVFYVWLKGMSVEYIYAIFSFFIIIAHDTIASPFIMLSSVLLKQGLNVRMSLIRWFLSLVLLFPLFFSASLKWVLFKDIVVTGVSIGFWIFYTKSHFKLTLTIEKIDWNTTLHKFKTFTLWSHLTGAITNIIYKIDAVILSFFTGLLTVGNYNIALSAGNVANLLPSLLAYQNSVAISRSHDEEQANRLTIRFFRLTFLISLMTLLGYLILGKIYLSILTGTRDNDAIYGYMVNIVIGILIVKTFISPLVAFINIKGSVRNMFFRVKLPMLLIAIVNYAIFASLGGAQGISLANIFNALLWVVLIMLEIRHYRFKIKEIFNFKEDFRDVIHYAKNLKLLH